MRACITVIDVKVTQHQIGSGWYEGFKAAQDGPSAVAADGTIAERVVGMRKALVDVIHEGRVEAVVMVGGVDVGSKIDVSEASATPAAAKGGRDGATDGHDAQTST